MSTDIKTQDPYREPIAPVYCVNCIYASDINQNSYHWKCKAPSALKVDPVSGIKYSDSLCKDKNKNADCIDFRQLNVSEQTEPYSKFILFMIFIAIPFACLLSLLILLM